MITLSALQTVMSPRKGKKEILRFKEALRWEQITSTTPFQGFLCVVRIGLKYTYVHGDSRSCLTRRQGLDEWIQVQEVEKLAGDDPDLTRNDLQAVCLYIIHSEAISEAL